MSHMYLSCEMRRLVVTCCACLMINVFFIKTTYSVPVESQSYNLYQEGVRYQYEVGDDDTALKFYQRAIEQMTSWDRENMDFTGMYNDMGIYYSSRGEIELAYHAFEAVLEFNPLHLNSLSNFAALKARLGDIDGAIELYEKGIQVPNAPAAFRHNYGVFLSNLGNRVASAAVFDHVLETSPSFYRSRAEKAKQLCTLDRMVDSYSQFEIALSDAAEASDITTFWQIYFEYITSTPMLFPTSSYVEKFRTFYLHNLFEAHFLMPKNSISRPEVHMGCSYLGYYLIYQGHVDVIPRQLFSTLLVHVSGAAILPVGLDYRFLSSGNIANKSYNIISSASSNLSAINDTDFDSLMHIGFLGDFCNYGAGDHSVTLLTKGVIARLNRSEFSVIMISVSGSMPVAECQQSFEFADVVVIPQFSLNPAKSLQAVLDLSLDVLVFTEVGMNHDIFFLAHSRLALRTISFWGHAITSGIVDLRESPVNKRRDEVRGGPDYFVSSVLFEKCTPTDLVDCYHNAQQKYSERLILQEGLTTYFYHPPPPLTWREISDMVPPIASQCDVAEYRLPMLPDKFPFLVRFLSGNGNMESNSIHLSQRFERYGIPQDEIKLYCVPQTLYKLSPGNIDIIKKLLEIDESGVLVLLDGELGLKAQKQLVMNEFPSSSLDRIVFLRKLNQREYITLLAISDVVLDTFPVGGGRSSFAVFSTGTPIVMLYPKTSILQLTFGMYKAMGIQCSQCITYDVDAYILSSMEIVSNKTLQSLIRQDILKNNHRLYENKTVIKEWEAMLKFVFSIPRPEPYAGVSSKDNQMAPPLLAAVASNFDLSDEQNWVKDLNRIHTQTETSLSFTDWIRELPFNITYPLSYPYSLSPVRLSENWPSSGDIIHLKPNNRLSDYELNSTFDKEGISLGIIIANPDRNSPLTSQQKIEAFNKTIVSLKKGLGVDIAQDVPFSNIREVFVVDDGTVGMTIQDRVMFSSSFPSFHFIFERSQSKIVLSKQKRHWLKLRALNSIIKLSQYRYLFLIPSNVEAASEPVNMTLPLRRAAQLFQENFSRRNNDTANSIENPTFAFLFRFALQLLNGYANASSNLDGGRVSEFRVSENEHIYKNLNSLKPSIYQTFRQAAHIILLNSLFKNVHLFHPNRDEAQVSYGTDGITSCLLESSELSTRGYKIADGSKLFIRECLVKSNDRNNKEYFTAATPRAGFCACSVASETYLRFPTYFGSFVDTDIRHLCDTYTAEMLEIDNVLDDSYRNFTCLLALFDSDVQKSLSFKKEEMLFLRNIEELYRQPSLWDINTVSHVVQGLEKEFAISGIDGRAPAREWSRFRHHPSENNSASGEDDLKWKTGSKPRLSLVESRCSPEDLFHARTGVVFDKAEMNEYQNDANYDRKPSLCRYANQTAVNQQTNDKWCNVKRANIKRKSDSRQYTACSFIQRLLSSGVRIAYLGAK